MSVQSEMRVEGKLVTIAQLCRRFGLPRSTFYYRLGNPQRATLDEELTREIRTVIDENPTFGVRRRLARQINRKKVHRIIRINGWQVWQKPQGHHPAQRALGHRCDHIFYGGDGRCRWTDIGAGAPMPPSDRTAC